MKFLVYPFIFVLLSLNMLYSQPMVHGWAARYSGPGTYDGVRARSVFVDHAGNSYTAGDFTGSMDADPGSGTNLLTAPQSDIYITKLDQNGQYHWTTQLNCTGISQCNAISVDNNGDIYITGSFRDTLDADPGINSYNLISYGHSDCFIIKLDINGQFVWGKSFGGLSGDEGVSMALDEQAVYVTGTFVDSLKYTSSGSGALNTLMSNGGGDAFIIKLDLSGVIMNFLSVGGFGWDEGKGIDLDTNGNIIFTGLFRDSIAFNTTGGNTGYWFATTYWGDIFLAKLDPGFNMSWVKHFQSDRVHKMFAAVSSDNKIYVTGYIRDTLQIGPGVRLDHYGSHAMYLAKFGPFGNVSWTRLIAGNDDKLPQAIALDDSSNVYVTGNYSGNTDFDPGPGVVNKNGDDDIFVLKLDSAGQYKWVGVSVSHNSGFGITAYGYAIAAHISGSVFVAGIFSGTTDLDFGPGTDYYNNGYNSDGYTVKIQPCNQTVNIGIQACGTYISPSGKYNWKDGGTKLDTVVHASGCHTYYSINLDITRSDTIMDVSRCSSFLSPSGKYLWAVSGTYSDTVSTSGGCDSIVNINLTIDRPDTNLSIFTCVPFSSPSGKHTWDTSGTYIDTLITTDGCDSIININLTRNNASFSTVNISACQEYISPSGRYTWKANGTYTDTISNAVGCDSIMTINLSLLNNSSLINQLVVCKRYTSPSGQYTWTASGTYSDTVTNIHGCDSVITINLTVKNVDTLVTQAGVTLTAKAGFATFQWLNCDLNYAIIPGETQQSFTPQVNGSYAVRITQAGCTDTSGCKSINNVELQDAFNSIPFVSLYPNPTSGKVILELDRAYYKTQITVQSINGQKISSGSYDGQQKIELQLGTESGIFIIQIQLEEYDPIQLKVSKI